MFTHEQLEMLSAKLDASHVKSRQQAGRSLSYIEGWHAIAEANRIFGFDCWHRETVEIRCVSERERKIGKGQYERDGWAVSYVAKVRIKVGSEAISRSDIIREGVGAGHGIDADLGLAHESAIKEAETDATKRALMTFGNPFGLALYDKDQTEVERQPARKPEPAQPTNGAAKPRTTKEWFEDAKAELRSFTRPAEVEAWEIANKPKLDWLADKHPYVRQEIGNFMAERWQALVSANVP